MSGVWNTAVCQTCCVPPEIPVNASEVIANNRDLTQYIYFSTMQSQAPSLPQKNRYQFKSQTERLQTLNGKLTNPQSIAFRQTGGQGCSGT
jgi:hypothetical protein